MGDSAPFIEDPNYFYDLSLLPPALQTLSIPYHKILKVNLLDDTYSPIKVFKEEMSSDKGYKPSFSGWLKSFEESGQIYDADSDIYEQFTNIDQLRKYFQTSKEPIVLRYRRNINGIFKWVLMELHAALEYNEENQFIFLYIHDIDDTYSAEIEEQRALQVVSKTDVLTGLSNFYAFKILCTEFSHKQEKPPVGLVFADLNGLKIINDTQGHDKGNEFILSFTKIFVSIFSNFHCFRISGDEFIAVSEGLSREEFEQKTMDFHKILQSQIIPPAAIGWVYEDHPFFIEDLTKPAEMKMYQDKHEFYEKHPDYKRSIAEKSFQNEMSTIIKLLSSNYKTLFVIDLKKDTYKILKQSYGSDQEKHVSYTQHLSSFVTNYVDENYQDIRLRIGSIEYLKKELLHENTISCDFMLKNGSWHTTSFHLLESVDGIPSKVILYSIDIDKGKSNRIRVENMSNQSILFSDVIYTDYSMICEVDTATGMMQLIKINSEFSDEVAQSINNQEFYTVREWFIKTFVKDTDVAIFSEKCDIKKITEHLKTAERYDLYCHTYGILHNQDKTDINISKFSFFNSVGNKGKILFATKNLTEELINLSINL